MKDLIRKILGQILFNKIREFKLRVRLYPLFLQNYCVDARLFHKHSNVFSKNSLNKIEALIILRYHSIEKGLLHDPIRPKFAIKVVEELIELLELEEVVENRKRSQINIAYLVLCQYYEFHLQLNEDISHFFPSEKFKKFKNYSDSKLTATINHDRGTYFKNSMNNFFDFSNSRSSVRNYSGEKIPVEKIVRVIDLAKNAPSVCNRQPVKVHCVNDKYLLDEVLQLQGGLKGYTENISQLLVVTSDRNYFYTVGERNQMYIDGGLFLMNLLYALHYYEIAACPAHWGMNIDKDKKIQKILDLPQSEKVISLVSIGIPNKQFKTTLSHRRPSEEVLSIID